MLRGRLTQLCCSSCGAQCFCDVEQGYVVSQLVVQLCVRVLHIDALAAKPRQSRAGNGNLPRRRLIPDTLVASTDGHTRPSSVSGSHTSHRRRQSSPRNTWRCALESGPRAAFARSPCPWSRGTADRSGHQLGCGTSTGETHTST